MAVTAYWLGTVPYQAAWALQRAIVAAVRAGSHPDSLLLLEHPDVFTIGRRSDGSTLLWSEQECARRGVEVVWTDRGGDATYHGPGQLVGYPIVRLSANGRGVREFVRGLEELVIDAVATFGVVGHY